MLLGKNDLQIKPKELEIKIQENDAILNRYKKKNDSFFDKTTVVSALVTLGFFAIATITSKPEAICKSVNATLSKMSFK